MAPLLDVLLTLLHWGAAGWDAVRAARVEQFGYLRSRLGELAARHGERVLASPGNPISVAMSLGRLEADMEEARRASSGEAGTSGGEGGAPAAAAPVGNGSGGGGKSGARAPPPVTFLGSMLFARCVSGTRVVARGAVTSIGPHRFVGYGSSVDAYPCAYLSAAGALGVTRGDVDAFIERLDGCLGEFGLQGGRASALLTCFH